MLAGTQWQTPPPPEKTNLPPTTEEGGPLSMLLPVQLENTALIKEVIVRASGAGGGLVSGQEVTHEWQLRDRARMQLGSGGRLLGRPA